MLEQDMQENSLAIVPSSSELTPDQFSEALADATAKATMLKEIVTSRPEAYALIHGKKYLKFEAWQTIGRAYGLTVRSEIPKEYHDHILNGGRIDSIIGTAQVLNDAGTVVGGADAYCGRDEPHWEKQPSFAIASMAQTRAGGKALRNMLAWVAILAGYEPTPAEEMTGVGEKGETAAQYPQPTQAQPEQSRTSVSSPAPSYAERKQPTYEEVGAPTCMLHKAPMRWVPAGTSPRTGNSYDAFWGDCDLGQRGEKCIKPPGF
jgi:hypothetical protein